ncbi:hypothetical protein H6F51_14470 [Cyanobacteria bacterium FACHB-DQ100]|uniref:baeRF7 domain-containing protein n=1 Tax=unclassified Leptolyngbya TaxID=2650499 RepID=UPI0016811CDA|nr:hypothetical protein [Leptolyngbya sp. FACHB-17]MBD1823688.1 hypothetical protein [Cyanobacteria bacterium FACHB-DQ100]MBD2079135.1 hypothetical protein [Leptolyngbya sp. FACHB-17]
MSILTVEQVKSLIERPKSWCVSIYMPTIVAGPEVRQNEIRFKNLVRQAVQELQETGLSEDEANEFLRPMLEAINSQDDFWEQQDRGLAIFVTDGFFHYFKVPRELFELVVVTDQFHLKPILPLLNGDGTFYILELSQKRVKLYEGDRDHIREVQVPDLPQNMDELLQYDESQKAGQFRIGTTSGASNYNNSSAGTGVFHGQGSPDRDDVTRRYRQFFYAIDAALHDFLNQKRAPLVLACVEYLMPIYREANTFPHLMEEGITGNVKDDQLGELHAEAWKIVEPFFTQAQEKAVNAYHELSNTDLSSTNLEETVPAAYYGRVDRLFVAVGVQKWGRFNPNTNEIEVHKEAQPEDEDLLDAAALQTILNGGTVYAVAPDAMPAPAPIAAVFRY